MFATKLRALEFPGWASFQVTDEESFRILVLYLEERKIRWNFLSSSFPPLFRRNCACFRFHSVEKREALRHVKGAGWESALLEVTA